MTFLSSISMQREKIEKQFKETEQKHKTSVPGWHSVVSQKGLIFISWVFIMLFNMEKFHS